MNTQTPAAVGNNEIPVVQSKKQQPQGPMVAILQPRLGFDLAHLVDYLNACGIATMPFTGQDENGNLVNDNGQVILPVTLRPHVQTFRVPQQSGQGEAPASVPAPAAPAVETPAAPAAPAAESAPANDAAPAAE